MNDLACGGCIWHCMNGWILFGVIRIKGTLLLAASRHSVYWLALSIRHIDALLNFLLSLELREEGLV